jgi:NDP-4-keto-2,6-dideoxyhexose 3-C-methyltransferase
MALLLISSVPQDLPTVKEITRCRGCQSTDLREVVNLGNQYVVDFVKSRDQVTRPVAPLVLVLCGACRLVQLKHTVPADTLFKRFWYLSSMNEQMCLALQDVVRSARAIQPLHAGDSVLDIGCNDGYLLGQYGERDFVRRVGFDPAEEVIRRALDHDYADVLVADYFTAKRALDVSQGKYKIITAIAMFYDLEDPAQFLREVEECLDDNGLFVIQMNYLMAMLRACTFDNISHEHLCYYSLQALIPLLDAAGLRLVQAEKNDVNGGSIRLFIRKSAFKSLESISYLIREEPGSLAGWMRALQAFNAQIVKTCYTVNCYLTRLGKDAGAYVYVYGASTRGTTILQTLLQSNPLLPQQLVAAAERDPRKYGLHMVGTWIPIVSEEAAREFATHFFLLPYSFLPGIVQREAKWLARGGELIVPLPTPQVVTKSGPSFL